MLPSLASGSNGRQAYWRRNSDGCLVEDHDSQSAGDCCRPLQAQPNPSGNGKKQRPVTLTTAASHASSCGSFLSVSFQPILLMTHFHNDLKSNPTIVQLFHLAFWTFSLSTDGDELNLCLECYIVINFVSLVETIGNVGRRSHMPGTTKSAS